MTSALIYAWRSWRASPGVAALAAVAFAVGIGSATAIYTVVSGVIVPQLFKSIYSADLVIADVSCQNPNVYYELGVRHSLRPRGTLLIRRSGGENFSRRIDNH